MTYYRVRNRRGRVVCCTADPVAAEVVRVACGGVIEQVRRQVSWAERHEQVAA